MAIIAKSNPITSLSLCEDHAKTELGAASAAARKDGLVRSDGDDGDVKKPTTLASGKRRNDGDDEDDEEDDDPRYRSRSKKRVRSDARARLRAARKRAELPPGQRRRAAINNPYAKKSAPSKPRVERAANPYAGRSPAPPPPCDYESLLFKSSDDPGLAGRIVRIARNDPEVRRLAMDGVRDLNVRAWRRLGDILKRSSHVEELSIRYCYVDVLGLCASLQNNRGMRKISLRGIDLGDRQTMSTLALCLGRVLSLSEISLAECDIGSAGIEILSRVLSNRLEDTLAALDLDGNNFGDMELDALVEALRRNRSLKRLSLHGNGIGMRGCVSLASLLEDLGCHLEDLDLGGNCIDNTAAVVLADSAVGNARLRTLVLGGNCLTAVGQSAFSKCPTLTMYT